MKRRLSLLLALAVLAVLPLSAQPGHDRPDAHNRPHANQGHVPPPPRARPPRGAAPEVQRLQGGQVNRTPHVDGNRWYGHERPEDPRLHLARPFAHGRFAHVGPSFHYRVTRFDLGLHRFWLPGGFFFEIAAQDWPLCADWCWNCGDDFVIYEDPDHPGWYLVYNAVTGVYVHAQYYGG
ncbi:MAG TPA: hypothetical protein VIH93_13450 [Thermoanaerobaculia bacterium]|jgi:hypothetical protein